jgi:large repetitive protein
VAQYNSSVAADPAGNFVVVWQSLGQDGSGFGIFGQRFGPILPVELMHFRVE